MFTRFMPHHVRFIEGEDGVSGGGTSELSESPELTVVDNDSAPEIADNPAWNDILSPVPQEFHGHLKEHLSKKDKYTQEVQQTYAPFKEFVESGVSKEDIEQSMQLAHIFQTNPRGLFDFLNTQYNYLPVGQQTPEQGQNSSQGQNAEDFDISGADDFDITKNPQFQQVAQRAELAETLANQINQRQLEDQVNQQIQTEVASLEKNYPHIPIQEIVKRAVANASISGGREDLEAAAKEIDGYGWFQPKTGTPAPPNLSGGANRGLPSSQVNPSAMSPEERTRYVAGLLKNAVEG